jgi:GNAT superfamily N-acetyltransferase
MSDGARAKVSVERATGAHGAGLSELYARSNVACHCRYWHFSGTTNDWLARVAHAPEVNRAEMLDALEHDSSEMAGMVATADGGVIGWMKLSPASSLPKLYDQRIYRRLPIFDGDRADVYAIGCFLVDPECRGQGVSNALLEGGIEWARTAGVRIIEAFPRRGGELRDEERFSGSFSAYSQHGFSIVHDFAPYPVMRLHLA